MLSEALSKCLTLPLGERVFIFLNFQQTLKLALEKRVSFHSLPRSKLGLWLGGDSPFPGESSLSRCHQRNQLLGRILSLQTVS